MKMKMNANGLAPTNGAATLPLSDYTSCKSCGESFTLTSDERDFFTRRKLNLPRRCKRCRDAGRRRFTPNAGSEAITYGDASLIADAVVARLASIFATLSTTPPQARPVHRRTVAERDEAVAALLAVLTVDGRGLPRKAIQAALRLSDADWESVSRDAIRRGQVRVTGRGRGTRYVLVNSSSRGSV